MKHGKGKIALGNMAKKSGPGGPKGGITTKQMPSGKEVPKGGPHRPQGHAPSGMGLKGKMSIKGGSAHQKGLISQKGEKKAGKGTGKDKVGFEARALKSAVDGKGGY